MDTIRVLHVDDEPSFGDLVSDFLEREDDRIEVLAETSAGDGISRIESEAESIDCIVSDYDMPGMDGLEFLDALREEYPNLPFILYTGKGSEEVASEAMSKGATDYLQKGSGTEQYELLANRIRNAVEQYRSRRRAAEHERIARVMRELNRALIYADSVDEIEHEVCDVLSDADPYVTACIAGVDTEAMTIQPRTWAGEAEGYFEKLDMAVDENSPGRQAPGGRAFHEREIAVSQDISDDPTYEEWSEAAAERGFRSLAVVPLEYENDLYGLLAIFADRPFAFDETEQDLLSELGDDIAHAMRAQEMRSELRETASRLEALFERSPDMINIHDTDGNLLDPNPRLREKTGYDEDELTDMKIWDLDRRIEPEEVISLWEDMDTGDSHRLQGEYQRKEGSTFPVEVHIRQLDLDGQERFIAISRDISDRRKREKELRRTERRYQAILEDPNILAGVVDIDGRLLEVNQTALDYIDADKKDVIGAPFWDTPWWSEETRPVVRQKVEQAAGGEYVEYEADLKQPDGTAYSVEGVIRPVTDETDNVVSLIVSSRDVTQRKAREQTLQEVNQRFELLAEAVPNGLFLVAADYSELYYCNSAAEELYGVDIEELRDDPSTWMRHVHPDDLNRLEEDIEAQQHDRIDGTQQQKFRIQHPDRGTRWLEVDIYPIEEDGEIERLAGVATDITEREQRRRTLERYQKIVETMDDVAFVVDDEWHVAFTNETIFEYVEVPLEVLEGQPVMRLADEFIAEKGDAKRFEQALKRTFQQASEKGSPERIEVTLDVDGETPIFEYQFSPLVSDGETTAAVVTMRDITERKERERELVETRDRMEFALERTDAVIWERDLDTGEITTYPEPCPLTEDTVETAKDFVETVHPDDREAVSDTVETVTETGEPKQVEYRIDDGSASKWIETQVEPVSEHGDSVAQLIGLTQDITDRKQRERALKRQNERFDELASAVSHDLQTPLATARGRAELAVETGDTEQMEQAVSALERVDELRESLVEVLRTKEIISETEPVDIGRVGRDAWETMQTPDDASLQIRDELSIDADPDAVQRFFENILSNAIEHGSADTTVRIGEIEGGFFIEDDGPGIPEDERDEVFTPGYSTKSDGSGVGLASVRQIVMAHDWEISVTESSEGGARFEITDVNEA